MPNSRSPPKRNIHQQYKSLTTGGSNSSNINSSKMASSGSSSTTSSSASSSSPLQLKNSSGNATTSTSTTTNRSTSMLTGCTSTQALLNTVDPSYKHSHYHHYHYHHSHHHQQATQQHQLSHSGGGNQYSSRTSLTPSLKRGKKNWGSRERSGMSFLIVIAFFAVFGLIILTEVFMIDERSHSGMLTIRQSSNMGGRLGDSMPDYDNVKDDYDLLDDSLLGDNKLGFVQFRDNKLKIQVAKDGAVSGIGRYAGILLNGGNNYGGSSYGGGGGAAGLGGSFGVGSGANVPPIPWGQVLPKKMEETLPHFPFGTTPTDGSWQVVNGTRFKFFVFSAYYDRRDGARLVRVVGATKTRGPERVWCRFWYNNVTAAETNAQQEGGGSHQRAKFKSATVMARVKIIRENWNLKYSACFVLCPVRATGLETPQYVSVVSRLRTPPGNLLQLRNTDWDTDFKNNNISLGPQSSNMPHLPPSGDNIPDKIAVCVKPFHFNYDQALYLMEYMEFYALLGVTHFTFYNHTLGPHASCILEHYMKGDVPSNFTAHDFEEPLPSSVHEENNVGNSTQYVYRKVLKSHYTKPTVNILPWNLRMRSQKEIRTEGLFAALNDCLYRTMYRYKYLALVDLDEFIVPRYTDTLYELINSLNERFRNRNTGAYSFQNAFFYLQFADDPLASKQVAESTEEQTRVRAALVTQRKTRRRYKLHPQKQRSKYICKPEAVVEAGNHFVWEFSPGKGSLNVPPKEAILQHYRVCEFGGNDCIKAPSIIDRTTTKYVNRLVQRVDEVYKYLRQRCDLPPLPVLMKSQNKIDIRERKPIINIKNNNNNIISNDNDKTDVVGKGKVESKNAHESAIKVEKSKNTTKDKTTKKVQGVGGGNDPSGMMTATAATTTTTTKETATKTTITANTGNGNTKAEEQVTRVRKKRKLVVFEQNEYGLPVARVEYQ